MPNKDLGVWTSFWGPLKEIDLLKKTKLHELTEHRPWSPGHYQTPVLIQKVATLLWPSVWIIGDGDGYGDGEDGGDGGGEDNGNCGGVNCYEDGDKDGGNPYQPILTHTNPYQPIPTHTNPYQPIPTHNNP